MLPKLRGSSLLGLLRYAYGFRRLNLISETSHFSESCGFEDLLVHQLNSEVQELLSRGLQRSYTPRNEPLESPRGQIDIQQLARLGGKVTATLPCRHYPRIEDTLLNRVLVSGLKLAGSIASNVELRRESRRLAGQIEEQVSAINLNAAVMSQVERQLTRLTKNYQPAMSIVRLLVDRDIWEKDLPRHMLYQLVVYAVSHRDQPRSTILYPTLHPGARETRIEVMDPVYGNVIGEVRLMSLHTNQVLFSI